MTNSITKRIANLFWERKLGISTHGVLDVEYPDANHYATMWYSTINRVLGHFALNPSDVLVDIGCGKGRVVCLGARSPLRKVIGIEISPVLADIARKNADQLKGRQAPIEIHNCQAQDFDYSEATVLIIFNPFGPSTVELVLKRIKDSVDRHPIRIAYINPVYDQIFADSGWLQRMEHWEKSAMSLQHSVTFYTSRKP